MLPIALICLFAQVAFAARGLMPPVFTSLYNNGSINYDIIPAYVKFLLNNGIKSVLVGGTSGEHMCLSVANRKALVDKWVEVGKPKGLYIMAQVGGAPLPDVLDLAEYYSTIGVDSLLTLPELYFKPKSVSDLVSYVKLVADRAPNLPVFYYHIPQNTDLELPMPAFVTEATKYIPNFKGIKFTSNDLSEGAQVLKALNDDQEMFLGADVLLAPGSLLGIKSSIGTTYNMFPRLAQDILDAVDEGDVTRAKTLQEKLSSAVEAINAEGAWVPSMKAAMEIVTGIKMGPPLLPQREVSKKGKIRMAAKLQKLMLLD